jgi:hypothetical protein
MQSNGAHGNPKRDDGVAPLPGSRCGQPILNKASLQKTLTKSVRAVAAFVVLSAFSTARSFTEPLFSVREERENNLSSRETWKVSNVSLARNTDEPKQTADHDE